MIVPSGDTSMTWQELGALGELTGAFPMLKAGPPGSMGVERLRTLLLAAEPAVLEPARVPN